MHDYLTLVATVAGTDVSCLMLSIGIAALALRRCSLRWAAALLAFVVLDALIALAPIAFKLNPGQWNWFGQAASVVLALSVTYLALSPEEVGLRLPRTPRAWGWTVAGIVAALLVATWPALFGPGDHPMVETLFYQATLPGVTEELAIRGVVLALLIRTFAAGDHRASTTIAAAAITVGWFTAGHVLHVEDGHLVVLWRRVLDVAPMATVYVVTRLGSGSLLGSVLAHNAANTLVEVAALIRF